MLTPRTTAIVDTVFHPRYVRLIHEARRVNHPFCGVLGAPLLGPEADRTLFGKQSAILVQAFDEEAFSHHGKH